MSLNYEVAAFSIQGRKTKMEDVYYLNPEKGLFVIADGVGGSLHGAEASTLALNTVVEVIGKGKSSTEVPELETMVKEAVTQAHHAVYTQFGGAANGSTTLTVLLVVEPYLVYGSVGDSRLYVVRSSQNSTSSWWNRSISTPLLFHRITTDTLLFIGSSELVPDSEADSGTYQLTAEDGGFLLCTDGFYRHLSLSDPSQDHFLPWRRTSFPNSLSHHFGKVQWEKKEGKVYYSYERSPQQEIVLLEQKCADAFDNTTAIYALFQNQEL